MAELRHLISQDSELVLRAVQARAETPDVVDNMTRSEFYDHLAIRTRMGASQAEIEAKTERWGSMRDAHELIRKAARNVRANKEQARRAEVLRKKAVS